MKVILFLFLAILPITTAAQQKRQTPAKPQPKATTPAPTFDTLIPADSYTIYGEVRGAGQLIRSNTVNEMLEPVLKLAGSPKEFKSIVKWLNAHADEVMTSRLLVASWPTNKTVPQTIIAIEFASVEEATKFVTPLNEFLPTVLPTPEPSPSPSTEGPSTKAKPTAPPAPPTPSFHLQRLGSLVLITPKPWTMKQLKPAGSKLLAEDPNFRTARNRFSSEPVFVYIDVKALEREEEERRKGYEAAAREEAEQVRREQATAAPEQKKEAAEPEKREMTDEEIDALEAQAQERAKLQAIAVPESAKEPPAPDPMSSALSGLAMSLLGGEADWPDGVALAASFEGESIDLRGLFVNAPGEKSDVVLFWPKLVPGLAIAPESPTIFPADTELFVMLSLDLPQVYVAMSKPGPGAEFITSKGDNVNVTRVEAESPFAAIEKRLKINIKDELLPLLGSEIALGLPMEGMGMVGISGIMIGGSGAKENQKWPVLAIEVRDKERLRDLLPKLVEAIGFKGASSFAQTERREDTELVSFANVFAYAFVGDFLVLSMDAATTRKIVDAYLKHETLAGDTHFKNYTRWQPRQLYGQVYASPALMESFKAWAAQSGAMMSDQTRAFLTRINMLAQPVTYSLSNEGLGPLHELHLPKNLVLMALAGIAGEANPSPMVQRERMAIGVMYMIASAEEQYKTSNGSFGTLEQLIAEDLVPKEMVENSGYRFDVTVSGDKFEASAAPLEYGKTGKMSFFTDHTRVIRGGDRGGASATASDPPIN